MLTIAGFVLGLILLVINIVLRRRNRLPLGQGELIMAFLLSFGLRGCW